MCKWLQKWLHSGYKWLHGKKLWKFAPIFLSFTFARVTFCVENPQCGEQ